MTLHENRRESKKNGKKPSLCGQGSKFLIIGINHWRVGDLCAFGTVAYPGRRRKSPSVENRYCTTPAVLKQLQGLTNTTDGGIKKKGR